MNKKILLIASLLICSEWALADNIHYNYIEADYQYIDFDDGDGVDVGRFDLSIVVWDNLYFFTEAYTDFDLFANVDTGLGYYFTLADHLDFIVEAGYGRLYLEDESDEDGVVVGLGLRAGLSRFYELTFKTNYEDLAESFLFETHHLFEINERWGISALLSIDDDGNAGYGAGVRFTFD